jgi:ArsR family transcriptional regulator
MALNQTLKAISDPIRRAILESLRQQDLTAGAIADQFDLTPATVSYHLKLLRQASLISQTKDKNFVIYSLNTSVFEELLTWIYELGGDTNENKN